MTHPRRDPGAGIDKRNIYEVWGDVVEGAAGDSAAVIDAIYGYIRRSYLAEEFQCQFFLEKQDNRRFFSVQWGDIAADVDARPFGDHLDVYAILWLKRGLLAIPDPAARIADLEGWQRRDLQVFQTILKQAMEEALQAVDEGLL